MNRRGFLSAVGAAVASALAPINLEEKDWYSFQYGPRFGTMTGRIKMGTYGYQPITYFSPRRSGKSEFYAELYGYRPTIYHNTVDFEKLEYRWHVATRRNN